MSVSNQMNNTISGSQLELILEKSEAKANELTLSWIDKWNQTKELSSSQTNSFLISPSVRSQKFSSGFLLQPDLPYIVSINDDRLSTGIMIFYIKDGDTVLGKDENSADIALNDKNLSESHCIFQNIESIVTITPIDNSLCFVNNLEVKNQVRLCQGDEIKVGKYSFRFNHPEEAQKLRENEQEILNKKFLKSQSLPSLARHNLSNEGLLMAKCVQKTNNNVKMENFDEMISRSSSFISSDYSSFETNTNTNSISEIRNDIKNLNNLKMDECKFDGTISTNFTNQINAFNKIFQSKQVECKKDYDQKLKEFDEKIHAIDLKIKDSIEQAKRENFDYDKYFYSKSKEDHINYIDNFRVNSILGRKKHKFNLELKFFMNLKQIRLDFIDEINSLNQQQKSNKTNSSLKAETSTRKSNIPIRASINLNKNVRLNKQISNESLNFRPEIKKETTKNIPIENINQLPSLLHSDLKPKLFNINEKFKKNLDIDFNVSSMSCPVLCEKINKCINCYHMGESLDENFKRSKSTNDILSKQNINKIIPASRGRLFNIYKSNSSANILTIKKKNNSIEKTLKRPNSSSNTILSNCKTRVIIYSAGRTRKKNLKILTSSKRNKSIFKKPMKNTKQSSLKRKLIKIKSLDCCNIKNADLSNEQKDLFHNIDSEFESHSSSSRAQSVESSRTNYSNKNCKASKNLIKNCNHKTKNCIDFELHGHHHHKHLFPFYFSYNLKDSEDDCLNRKTKNLFKSSMNRIDNTHATFLNCLRDWNDPFLHGHKQIKAFGCQRCESCACRSMNSSNQSIHRDNCHSPSHHDSDRHYLNDTHSKLNRNFVNTRNSEFLTGFQPIIRCKSSANVPKTIDQSNKLSKSRPRPSSIKIHVSRKCTNECSKKLNNSKMSTNSIESDKDSNDTLSKEDDFKILFQTSSPESSMSQISKGTNELIYQNNEENIKENSKVNNEANNEMSKQETDQILLKNHDFSMLNQKENCLENATNIDIKNSMVNENPTSHINSDNNIVNLLSSSTSSLLDNDDIVYDDSLQDDDSFESDSLMVDSDTKHRIQTSFDEKNVKEIQNESLDLIKNNIDQENKIILLLPTSNSKVMTTKQELFDSIIGESINESVIENGCKQQNRLNPIQQGFKEFKKLNKKRRKSLSDSIEELNSLDKANLLKKYSPNRSFSESYLNDNDTDIDQDFDCSNYEDFCINNNCKKEVNQNIECQNNTEMDEDNILDVEKKLPKSPSFEKYKLLERQPTNPVNELEDQMKFYERVKDSFFSQLDKSMNQSNKLNLTPPSSSSSSPRRRSTSSEQKFLSQSSITSINSENEGDKLESNRVVYKFSGDIVGGEKCMIGEFSLSSRSSSRSSSFSKKSSEDEKLYSQQIHPIVQNETRLIINPENISVPTIIVHETNLENENKQNEKSILEDISNHDDLSKNIETHKSIIKEEFSTNQSEPICISSYRVFEKREENLNNLQKRRRSFKLHQESSFDNGNLANNNDQKGKKLKFPSFFNSSSPVKKRAKMEENWLTSSKIHSQEVTKTQSIDTQNLRLMLEDELNSYEKQDEDDEFFLAISASGFQTGSCPEFYWYPSCSASTTIKKKRTKSENDLIIPIKSYENITHTNYVQMINSMINGAISDVADPEYVDYLKRHIQGLFDNFTPVLMKSKSNEEIAIMSPSRDKISEILNQTMPKSFSFDFKFLEESKFNQSEDVMDFSKFGLGIKDHQSSDESMESDELDRSFIEDNKSEIEDLVIELINKVNSENETKNFNFELNELQSSTKINFEDSTNEENSINKLSNSMHQNSVTDDSTQFGSESYASTIVLKSKFETHNSSTESPSSPSEQKSIDSIINPLVYAKESNQKINLQSQNLQDENVNLINGDSDDDDYSETHRLIRDSDTETDTDSSENSKEYKKQNIVIENLDDVIIECKINYKMKTESDSDSSFTDSDDSEKRESDYDNIGKLNLKRASSSTSLVELEVENAALSTSAHSINSVESSNHNLVNETLASLTSITSNEQYLNKSLDDEEEPDYNFVDDFTDLSKELDENWIQEDDSWYTTTVTTRPIIHPPRLLDPIVEEDDSELKKKPEEDDDINFKQTEDLKNLYNNVEQFKVSFEYKYKTEYDQKLRSKDCDIDALLGSSKPNINNKKAFNLLSAENLVSTRIDEKLDDLSDEDKDKDIKLILKTEDLIKNPKEVDDNLLLEIEAKYANDSTSESSFNEENNETLKNNFLENYTEIQKDSVLDVEAKYSGNSSSNEETSSIKNSPETLIKTYEEIQKDSFLEVAAKYGDVSMNSSEENYEHKNYSGQIFEDHTKNEAEIENGSDLEKSLVEEIDESSTNKSTYERTNELYGGMQRDSTLELETIYDFSHSLNSFSEVTEPLNEFRTENKESLKNNHEMQTNTVLQNENKFIDEKIESESDLKKEENTENLALSSETLMENYYIIQKDSVLEVETKYGDDFSDSLNSSMESKTPLIEVFKNIENCSVIGNVNEIVTKKDSVLELNAKYSQDNDCDYLNNIIEKKEPVAEVDKILNSRSGSNETLTEIEKYSFLEVEAKYNETLSDSFNSSTETKEKDSALEAGSEINQTLTEKFTKEEPTQLTSEFQKDSVLEVETKYNDETESDTDSVKKESYFIENIEIRVNDVNASDETQFETKSFYDYESDRIEETLAQDLTEAYDELKNDSHLEVETIYKNKSDSDSDLSYNDERLVFIKDESLTEGYEEIDSNSHLNVETEYSQDLNNSDFNDNYDKRLQIETKYSTKQEQQSDDEEEVHVEYFEYVISKDLIFPKEIVAPKIETHVSDEILSEDNFLKKEQNITDNLETQVNYEYVESIETEDENINDSFRIRNALSKKSESEFDLSKLKLSLNEDHSSASDKLKEVLSDIEKEIKEKSPILSPSGEPEAFFSKIKLDTNEPVVIEAEVKYSMNETIIMPSSNCISCSTETQVEQPHDKCYQVNPAELDTNMVDCQTQSTPPVSPIKKLKPLKKNAATETDESEIFSNYLILTEEQKLRKKLQEKENSLKLTTIATQTETDQILIQHLEAKENRPVKPKVERVFEDKSNVKKILIVNEDNQNDNSLKLNIRQKIKIQNLDNFVSKSNVDQLAKVTDEFYNLPNQIKSTHLKSIDIQTEPETKKESRSRSVSNSSTFIDLLSLNLDRSKTWVELTEAKLNYMIGETDAVLRSMNLDSSDDESKKSKTKNLTIDTTSIHDEISTPRSQTRNQSFNNSNRLNTSYTSPRIQLISPDQTMNCLTSTTKTIEEMTQVYLDNYKRQLEDSRKELSTKMHLLELEKDKISKIRDSRKKELYMRRQAAIEAFKLERERELRNSQNDDSIVYDDLDDDDLDRTFRNSKRLVGDLPSQKREKLARLRRNVVLNSSGIYDDQPSPRVQIRPGESFSSTPRIEQNEEKITRKFKNIEWIQKPDSRLLIPIQKTFIQEKTETRIEHTTSSSSNSSSIIDESRLLLKEYEQLRNDSVSEIQRAHDSLHASLVWLENQKLNRLRTFQESKSTRDSIYSTTYSSTKSSVSRVRADENGPRIEAGRISRPDSTITNKPAKTRELSPVSRFREEQKEYLLRVNTVSSTTSNSNTNRKEIPISIYSPLSSSSFLSSSSNNNHASKHTTTNSTPNSTPNNKTRADQMPKSNPTTIKITDYSTKNPSNQSSYQRTNMSNTIQSQQSQQQKNKFRYIREYSDSDEDKIC